jgi:hypothetical protein
MMSALAKFPKEAEFYIMGTRNDFPDFLNFNSLLSGQHQSCWENAPRTRINLPCFDHN